MKRIRVKFYRCGSGQYSHARDYFSPEEAFEVMQKSGMDALAYPTGTAEGLWDWRRAQAGEWTLEKFREKMEEIGKG